MRDRSQDVPLESDTHDYDAFARILQSAYQEVHLHSPQALPDVAERLRIKLERHGVTLTPDIMRALAFAAVEDRGY